MKIVSVEKAKKTSLTEVFAILQTDFKAQYPYRSINLKWKKENLQKTIILSPLQEQKG